MLKSFLSVGALTLLSRGTGFLRDIVMGAVLGAGALADAFLVAFRLPNHFRAIFGEGAFNAAYVPSYARVLETQGPREAKRFSSQVFTILLISQVVLLLLAQLMMPQLVALLAPGFDADPQKFSTAVWLTRITFPYLLFMTLVTLHSGTLNANGMFTAAAFAPVLLNVVMVVFLGLAFLFPDAGTAAAVGVTVSGALQLGLMMAAARRAGVLEGLMKPSWSIDLRRFFIALGPAVIGSAGVQIATFADTIIASLLPTGAVSSIYYADRINQLPSGVIGIAAGTVLLPEMSRRFAVGDWSGAFRAQNRSMALTIVLTMPFFVAFICAPVLIMQAVFVRGAFTDAAAEQAGGVLAAYGVGLVAAVLIRSAVASFQARGDTTTPMLAALFAVAVNVTLKFLLYKPLGIVGLAIATSVGAALNLLTLMVIAVRRGDMQPDRHFDTTIQWAAIAGAALAVVTLLGDIPIGRFALSFGPVQAQAHLLLLGLVGLAVYAAVLRAGLRTVSIPAGDEAPAAAMSHRITKLFRPGARPSRPLPPERAHDDGAHTPRGEFHAVPVLRVRRLRDAVRRAFGRRPLS